MVCKLVRDEQSPLEQAEGNGLPGDGHLCAEADSDLTRSGLIGEEAIP